MDKKHKLLIAALISLIVVVVSLAQSLFVVDQTEQAIVMHMGKPVMVITGPGLYVKKPFLQQAVKFDNRLLTSALSPTEVSTRDHKGLVIDCYCQWKITDPLKFLESTGTQIRAQSRLDDVIRAELRAQGGLNNLADLVSVDRETIFKKVTEAAREKSSGMGITILDVRLKRASLPAEDEKLAFERMKAEREREARKYRAEGEEEALRIKAQAEKGKKAILAEAYKKAQEIKGEGEAGAMRISADAYAQDPDFYAFFRTLEAYRKTLKANTTFLFSEDNEFFTYLKGSHGQQKPARKGK
ncbi:MAG: protease modulator HflC [bacterium]